MAFNIIEEWMNANKLKMQKKNEIYIYNSQSIKKELSGNTILKCLDGTEIKQVEIMKYLEIIIIDNKLQFKEITVIIR